MQTSGLHNLAENAYALAMITAGQIRAARALIGWKQTDLAKAWSLGNLHQEHRERRDRSAFKYARRASTGVREGGDHISRAGRYPRRRSGREIEKGAAWLAQTDRASCRTFRSVATQIATIRQTRAGLRLPLPTSPVTGGLRGATSRISGRQHRIIWRHQADDEMKFFDGRA
jgi:hypothetical protein